MAIGREDDPEGAPVAHADREDGDRAQDKGGLGHPSHHGGSKEVVAASGVRDRGTWHEADRERHGDGKDGDPGDPRAGRLGRGSPEEGDTGHRGDDQQDGQAEDRHDRGRGDQGNRDPRGRRRPADAPIRGAAHGRILLDERADGHGPTGTRAGRRVAFLTCANLAEAR